MAQHSPFGLFGLQDIPIKCNALLGVPCVPVLVSRCQETPKRGRTDGDLRPVDSSHCTLHVVPCTLHFGFGFICNVICWSRVISSKQVQQMGIFMRPARSDWYGSGSVKHLSPFILYPEYLL